MSKHVLDASAVTAVLRQDPGHEAVIPHLRGSLISSVNLAEVLCTARLFGSRPELDAFAIHALQLTRIPFDEQHGMLVATIHQQTLGGTLGIADRACLALGKMHDLPVLTANQQWKQYDVGVEIRLFRKREDA